MKNSTTHVRTHLVLMKVIVLILKADLNAFVLMVTLELLVKARTINVERIHAKMAPPA